MIPTRTKEEISVFAPYICNKTIHCGLVIQEQNCTRNIIDFNNQLTLPYFQIK